MPYYFFPPTRSAAVQFANLFDFVWPTAAALWNLRWQVRGFRAELPDATIQQLSDRFVSGSGIHGSNLTRACLDTTWDNQKHNFSSIILINAFAIYEYWADQILVCVGEDDGKGKCLQFNNSASANSGLQGTLLTLCATESETLKKAYYPIYVKSKKYSFGKISNLLDCYRYFKELRNSIAHNAGIASEKAEMAYNKFSLVSDKASLGMSEELEHDPIRKGDKVHFRLRGVVGFCDILFRIMITVDAELSRSSKSEGYFEQTFKERKSHITLSSASEKRDAQVNKICRAAGFPSPHDISAVTSFLLSKRIISK